MRMEFGVDDDAALERAIRELSRRLEVWQAERQLSYSTWPAEQALHLKWGYLDGNLGRWTVADLDEILLELFPRKVSVAEDEWPDIPFGILVLLEFLADEGLLAADSDPLDRLKDALAGLSADFVLAMGDQSRWGMAKSFFGGDGAGASFGPRDVVVADVPPPPEDLVLPAGSVPDDDEAGRLAAATPAFQALHALVDWFGEKRTLAEHGHLRLADATELAGVLGTEDRQDPQIPGGAEATRSGTELHEVDLVFRLAQRLGVIQADATRGWPATTPDALAAAPLAVVRDAADEVVASGPLSLEREHLTDPPASTEAVDEAVLGLLVALLAPEPVPWEHLVAEAEAEAEADADLAERVPEAGLDERELGEEIGRALDRLAWLGLVERTGAAEETSPSTGRIQRTGGSASLTPLGRWWLVAVLQEAGWTVPVAGSLRDASAAALLDEVASWPVDAADAEIRGWAQGREDADEQLVTVARQATDPDEVARVLHALDLFGAAEEPARRLREHPATRAPATLWLVARGLEPPPVLDPAAGPARLVEQLEVRLVEQGPVGLAAAVVEELPGDPRVVEDLWRADDPATDTVLAAIAAHAPKPLSKAARKALFKRGVR